MIEVDGRPVTPAWDYTQAEKIADGFIHVIGLALAVCGGATLVVLASRSASWTTIATVGVYATSLVVALTFSAAYNMLPASGTKCLLRRFDQAAIFLLIGGTYTAFLTRAVSDPASLFVLAAVCAVAAIGALLKLVLPGRSDRLSIAAYLALGWSGLVLFPTALRVLPITAVCLIALGGLLYTAGVIFHMWKRLRFQNAIWHAFVLLAASCHYGAVLDCLVFART
ncbi:MAG: hemolysin III family protein [Beijerinckiaceae bacterium]